MQTKYRLGIDAGGTFTDFVLASADGQVRLFKALSTPSDPTRAMEEGLRLISEAVGESPEAIVRDADLCINGTTVGLNALIQHKGAKTGLICTAGHEDSIEIRLGHKEDGYRYDPDYPAARMLVPRWLRKGVRERVVSTGAVHTELHEEDVAAACAFFAKEGVESVAISFVWSVINPAHERRAAGIVRQMLPGVLLTTGSDLYPQVREYTRTSTAVVNAYLGPILRAYVDAVDGWFRALGAKNPVRYFQSNGGLATGAALADRPVYAINSGPASAPAAALHVAEPFGHRNLITIDMGGTSFDITLTKDGSANIAKDIDFLRYRLGIPMIQVETLGAGGGSIGHVDTMGLLQVGPQSAGAEPGPACYGRGGRLPTVTDANLVLGYLSEKGLVGGRLPLDAAAARAAVEEHVARPLGLSVERAAYGIFTIVNANMVNGIRRVSVERGDDPRDFVLVGAGGATAAHITAIAREMGISRILLPKLASGLCAFGQIISDVKLNAMAPFPARLDAAGVAERLAATFAGLEAKGIADLMQDGFGRDRIAVRRALDMRYVGQVHECTVDVGDLAISPATLPDLRAAFDRRHRDLYTYAEPQTPVEIVNIEASLSGLIEKPAQARLAPGRGAMARETREVVMAADGTRIAAAIYDGTALGAGDRITGPAIVEEETTTLVLEPGWTATLHESGAYLIERTG